MARKYRASLYLAHDNAFARVAYDTLRGSCALCHGDVTLAISTCSETFREVCEEIMGGTCSCTCGVTLHLCTCR